jgi:Domain of unknown function (DUF5063)
MDYSLTIAEFTGISREYCRWCEEPRSSDPRQLQHQALRLLARLYAAALELPDVDVSDEDDAPDLPDVDSRSVLGSFKDLPFQYYREIFDPVVDKEDEAVVGDLADDLTDIYIDLKRGLALMDRGFEPRAVFEWRCTFGFHWGRHATSAMRALHCYDDPDE